MGEYRFPIYGGNGGREIVVEGAENEGDAWHAAYEYLEGNPNGEYLLPDES